MRHHQLCSLPGASEIQELLLDEYKLYITSFNTVNIFIFLRDFLYFKAFSSTPKKNDKFDVHI